MATGNPQISNGIWASALLMLLALLWLTVSLPFVYKCQQQVAALAKLSEEKKETVNPLAGTNEEKSESGVNTISEYLHETTLPAAPFGTPLRFDKCHPADLYFAYHPELLCPPPNGRA